MYNYSHSGKPNTRIDVADILRGIAIGGIILIHFIEHMNFYSFPEATSAFWAKMNQAVWDSTFFLLAGKMYAIFAMLFGVVVGTLATIFIATPVAYLTNQRRADKAAVK